MGKIFLIALLSLACVSCWPFSGEAEKLEEALLTIPIGSYAKFTNLSPFTGRVICVVQPYQDRLALLDPLAVQVNAYLADHGFGRDESHFAFVLIGEEGFEVVKLRRSQKLDLLAIHEASNLPEQPLPDGLVARECVNWADALVAKVELGGRTLVRLGQMP